jgi:hypothetical protein
MGPNSKTHTGPNPSFFRFVKHMSRDSSKMSYTEHLLSSSSSLKNKEVLTNYGGGGIERSGSSFWNPLWQLLLSPFTTTLVCVSSYNWVICMSLSHTNSMCHYTFLFQLKSVLIFITLCSWYSSSQCCQVIFVHYIVQGKFHFKPSICSITIFHSCVSPYSFNPPSHITFLCMFRVDDEVIHHGPPSTSIFLSTSTDYPGIRLRNQLVPWDLHASMVGLLNFDSRFTPLILI